MVLANFNIEEIKKEVLCCKKILNLYNFEIKLEKVQNNISYTRFFNKDTTIITTSAIIWDKGNWKDFKIIKASISTKEILKKEEIKWLLLKEIYTEGIKYYYKNE